jgi:carbon monoxide dehydrogenase subunit G
VLISNRVEIPQPPEVVFPFLVDLEQVGTCIPGATLSPPDTAGVAAARVEVQFGPMRFAYDGRVRIVEADPVERVAVIDAEGEESAGEGTASAAITMRVSQIPAGSLVAIETDLKVTGGIAQLGRGMIEEFSQEMMEEFADSAVRRFETDSGGTEPIGQGVADSKPTPVKAGRVLGRVAWRRLVRLARRLGLSRARA